ncbi:substrate-binding periplasmic protein [Chitinimonas sp. PSY-7]|uniref:transporter substrate-binding domain-containing protein n=1 Tax=Chitinimonas sp. PSY-7 TaxID=3459088 RepID=UPI0040403759
MQVVTSWTLGALLCSTACWGSSNKVLLCAEDDFYPYSAGQLGKPVGLTVELMRAAFIEAGLDVELKPEPYNRCLESVKRGKYVATFDTAKTPDRKADYRWSTRPLTHIRMLTWGPIGLPHKKVDYANLKGQRVGIAIGYEYPAELLNDASIIKVHSQSEATNLRNVAAGRLAFTLVDARVAQTLINKHDLASKVANYGEISTLPIYAVFSLTHPQGEEMLAEFERGWSKLRAKGGVKRIEDNWSTLDEAAVPQLRTEHLTARD